MLQTNSNHLEETGQDAAPTVAVLIDHIRVDGALRKKKRDDMCSGLRSLCRALGLSSHDTLADPAFFRDRLAELTPAAAGMKSARLRNCKVHLDNALAYAGRLGQRKRSSHPVDPSYLALLAKVEDERKAGKLKRLFRFASEKRVPPEKVGFGLFNDFKASLEASTVANYRSIDREVRKLWNEMVETVSGWPQVFVMETSYVNHYVLPVDAFPASLWEDVEAYLESRRKKSFDIDALLSDMTLLDSIATDSKPASPIRESTADLIRYRVRQFASALVIEGVVEPEALTTLKEIVALERVLKGLKFFVGRAGGDARKSQIYGIAYDLNMIARLWTKSSAEDLLKFKAICKNVKPEHQGLPESARRSLAPLADPGNVRNFLRLPKNVIAEAQKVKSPDRILANIVATALWIRITQRAPLRINNALRIDIERNLLRSHTGKNATVSLFFTAEEVKNKKPLEIPLPASTVELLDLYLQKYRPLLSDIPNTWLFPAPNGGPKRSGVMATSIKKLMLRHLGFTINPHSFRHVAAKLYLAAHPGRYSDVQLLLGHKKLETTLKYYCELEAAEVFRHFDKVLLNLDEGEK